MPPPIARPLPERTDSVNAVKNAQFFTSIDEELRDSKRVQRQGQEEDLREALSRIMSRVEELCTLLKTSYQTNVDLETSLTLAQSNLKLALSNNEMLEDALTHNSAAKDVGWRRSSHDTSTLPPGPRESFEEKDGRRRSSESQSPNPDSAPSSSVGSPSPQQDTRFFRFGFSSGRSTPTQQQGQKSMLNGVRASMPAGGTGHLTSASLPSLVPLPPTQQELEDLRASLEAEKRKREKIAGEKESLEGELESLSQALFEEANKMVAMERIKRAEAEEELREARLEKEALRSALRLIEDERMRAVANHTQTIARFTERQPTHSRSSSRTAVKSPPPPQEDDEPRTSISSSRRSFSSASPDPTLALAVTTVVDEVGDRSPAPASPAPLYVPPPHLTDTPPSRNTSPAPLPHPHRLTTSRPSKPPAPPPPSATDGFAYSPWGRRAEASSNSSPVPRPMAFTPPLDDEIEEMSSPWG